MFRKMRRFKQQISEEECFSLLKNEKRGVLSIIGDEGYPYGIPMNHYYSEKDGKIYFHGAKQGHKIDSIRKNNKVCYTVFDKGYRKENEWSLNVKSVVVFGRISLVENAEKAKKICSDLCRKFTDDEEYLKYEIENSLKNVQCLEIEIEHITGKLVNES
ncbi:MAG: pyridoxamine 5'-phosphate oxidase family protein [Eubacterium sp.]|nr:pyridoxamine 5'-phosphate oxidase family protein [Eubacterium sp.]MBR7060391.1 pyridoxamine 5'-phosphate oxidase family protein [Eubacterium sp.]